MTELKQRAEELLAQAEAEADAWRCLVQGKFSLFGYWAAKVVQFRELLDKAHDPSPFRPLVELARNHTNPTRSEK